MRHSQLRAASRTLLLTCGLAAFGVSAWGQGAKKVMAGEGSTERLEREAAGSEDRIRERQQWLRRGRTALGENAAELLHRAYQQKMKMREAGSAQASAKSSAGTAVSTVSATSASAFLNWSSIGPAPIVSDPTGQQDYGAITGRVTAIAVDANDVTGNTVYVGGAFGGVWKSTNAANSNSALVTWT